MKPPRNIREVVWLAYTLRSPWPLVFSLVTGPVVGAALIWALGRYLGLTGQDSLDTIQIGDKLFDKLAAQSYPPIATYVVSLVTCMIGSIVFYFLLGPFLFPNVLKAAQAFQGKSQEIVTVARTILEDDIGKVEQMLGAIANQTGWGVAVSKIGIFGKIIYDEADSEKLYMTTLESVPKLASQSGFRLFSEDFITNLNKPSSTKRLVRIVRCDNLRSAFFLNGKSEKEKQSLRWFIKLHAEQHIDLYFATFDLIKMLAKKHRLEANKLDILMFDGRVAFGLENDPTTGDLVKWADDGREMCRLYAIDDPDTIKKYAALFDSLISQITNSKCSKEHGGKLLERIKSEGWQADYDL